MADDDRKLPDEDDVDATNAKPLSDFSADAKALATPAFREKHGGGFLVFTGPAQLVQQANAVSSTVMVEGAKKAGLPPPKSRFLVFKLEVTGRSPFGNFISVGRTRNNDVIIADESLSKFHAYFTETPKGFVLQDGGSTNGTLLANKPVPTRQQGEAVLVPSGMTVRFGGIEVIYLDTPSFQKLASLID